MERAPRNRRHRPLLRQPQRLRHDRLRKPRPAHPVRHRRAERELLRQPRPLRHLGEGPRRKRRPLQRIPSRPVLRLQPRHVDRRRTLALAGLAPHAQLQRLAQRRRSEHRLWPLLQHQPKEIRTTACRVVLFPRHHVGRTHRPAHRRCFAADAGPVAPLHRPLKTAALRIGKGALHLALLIPRMVAPVLGHRPRLRDVVGIEDARGVEGPFHPLQPTVGLGPHHPRNVGAPHTTIAMLARQRTPVLAHQVSHVARDRLRPRHIPRLLEVQLGAQVQLTHRGMGVVDAVHLVPRHQLRKLRNVGWQIRHRHRGVLHQRLRLRVAGAAHEHAEPGLPKLPDAADTRRRDDRVGIPQPRRLQRCNHPFAARPRRLRRLIKELDDQDRARVALQEPPVALLLQVQPRQIQRPLVQQLHRRRPMLHRLHRRMHRLVDGRKMRRHHHRRLRHGNQLQRHLAGHRQRPFAAAQHPRQARLPLRLVAHPAVGQIIQCIARVPALHLRLREGRTDGLHLPLHQRPNLTHRAAEQAASGLMLQPRLA